MPHQRRQARILAMQILCHWDAQPDESFEALHEFLDAQNGPQTAKRYAWQLVERYAPQRETIDQRLESASWEWSLSRISSVERNIMRIAVVELGSQEIPPKVALNEAIEIGREFGGSDSSRFINGVLNGVLEHIRQDEEQKR